MIKLIMLSKSCNFVAYYDEKWGVKNNGNTIENPKKQMLYWKTIFIHNTSSSDYYMVWILQHSKNVQPCLWRWYLEFWKIEAKHYSMGYKYYILYLFFLITNSWKWWPQPLRVQLLSHPSNHGVSEPTIFGS